MPKFSYDEWILRDLMLPSKEEDTSVDVEAQIAAYKREADGRLSHYEPVGCGLNEEQLSPIARLALQQLRQLAVRQFVVDYSGGDDEGFSHLGRMVTLHGLVGKTNLIEQLQHGILGEKVEESRRFYSPEGEVPATRADYAQDALDTLIHQVAVQLLGRGFGTGEYSLEGAFVVDLQSNTLTDIAPEES